MNNIRDVHYDFSHREWVPGMTDIFAELLFSCQCLQKKEMKINNLNIFTFFPFFQKPKEQCAEWIPDTMDPQFLCVLKSAATEAEEPRGPEWLTNGMFVLAGMFCCAFQCFNLVTAKMKRLSMIHYSCG